MERILIAGGTGFIGQALCQHLVRQGHSLSVLTRKPMPDQANIQYFHWDVEKGHIDQRAFSNVHCIINLTGSGIADKRWSNKRKQDLLHSRVDPLNLLFKYVSEENHPIKLLISSSAVGYYGAVTQTEPFTEQSPPGSDFLAEVCKQWEAAALHFKHLGTEVALLRKGVILGKEGGMYKKLCPLAKLGINTSLGSGNQFLPWISLGDLLSIYDFVLSHPTARGVFNAVASESITMKAFSNALLKSLHKKSFLPGVPALLLRLALGEQSSMLLEGSPVSNKKIKDLGFSFSKDSLEEALQALSSD